jgi:hypothetical protein
MKISLVRQLNIDTEISSHGGLVTAWYAGWDFDSGSFDAACRLKPLITPQNIQYRIFTDNQ